MDFVLAWMGKPDNAIPDNRWQEFLESYSPFFVIVVAVTISLTLLAYFLSARRRGIFTIDDVFRSFTPLYWILLAIPGALTAAILCFVQFGDALGDDAGGKLGYVLKIFLLSGAVSALLSYVCIAFIPGLTPARFRYRPTFFLHKKKSAA